MPPGLPHTIQARADETLWALTIMAGKKRIRLSPEARREQLLDSAAVFIQRRGLSNFTMDALAKEAGVSNPLIYKYFDTRLELLQELLVREFDSYNNKVREQLADASSFEEITRIFVSLNFEQALKGDVLSILRNQPDISVAIEQKAKAQDRRTGKFLVEKLAESYPLTMRQAEHMIIMGSGASIAAAQRYCKSKRNKKALIEDTVRFIFGGMGDFLS